jgi:hypothetical protein
MSVFTSRIRVSTSSNTSPCITTPTVVRWLDRDAERLDRNRILPAYKIASAALPKGR